MTWGEFIELHSTPAPCDACLKVFAAFPKPDRASAGESQLSSPRAAGTSRDLPRCSCLSVHFEPCHVVYPPPTPSPPPTFVHLSLLKSASSPSCSNLTPPLPPRHAVTHQLPSPGCCLSPSTSPSLLKRAALQHELLASIYLICHFKSPAERKLSPPFPGAISANCSDTQRARRATMLI